MRLLSSSIWQTYYWENFGLVFFLESFPESFLKKIEYIILSLNSSTHLSSQSGEKAYPWLNTTSGKLSCSVKSVSISLSSRAEGSSLDSSTNPSVDRMPTSVSLTFSIYFFVIATCSIMIMSLVTRFCLIHYLGLAIKKFLWSIEYSIYLFDDM